MNSRTEYVSCSRIIDLKGNFLRNKEQFYFSFSNSGREMRDQ